MRIAWLDYSEEEKDRNLDIISLFNERGTVDELGLGTIRDAFADMLFPGTSTLHTRARYFLFIPWIYLYLENKKVESSRISEKARKAEIQLIYALLDGGEKDGVIGVDAKEDLQRLPSELYWYGLFVWGIRTFASSKSRYHRFLDTYYGLHKKETNDDKEPIEGKYASNWHLGIPDAPDRILRKTTFKLEKSEALYLKERLLTKTRESMLAYLVDTERVYDEIELPWMHPLINQFPERLLLCLRHARYFSEIMWGATLLYNLMLAELSSNEELIVYYKKLIENWAKIVNAQKRSNAVWDRLQFWRMARSKRPSISLSTQKFVDDWSNKCMTLGELDDIINDRDARDMIKVRERRLKKTLARLENPRALENWGGESSARQIDYRWSKAQVVINDIMAGLKG